MFAKIKPMKNHKKGTSDEECIQYSDREDTKVLDLKIVFHNERMNMWNWPLKSIKHRDTPSQERIENLEENTGKYLFEVKESVYNYNLYILYQK